MARTAWALYLRWVTPGFIRSPSLVAVYETKTAANQSMRREVRWNRGEEGYTAIKDIVDGWSLRKPVDGVMTTRKQYWIQPADSAATAPTVRP